MTSSEGSLFSLASGPPNPKPLTGCSNVVTGCFTIAVALKHFSTPKDRNGRFRNSGVKVMKSIFFAKGILSQSQLSKFGELGRVLWHMLSFCVIHYD